MKRKLIPAAFTAAFLSTSALAQDAGDRIVMELEDGDEVVIQLRPDLAPGHVERIRTLIQDDFYDGVPFHRVIDGFMAQTGDPTGTGMGGSDYPDLEAEFSNESFDRGTVGMARSADPDSANSQFFIMFAPAPHLDGQYTVVGEVVEGMEHIDDVKKGAVSANGQVEDPDKVVDIRATGTEG